MANYNSEMIDWGDDFSSKDYDANKNLKPDFSSKDYDANKRLEPDSESDWGADYNNEKIPIPFNEAPLTDKDLLAFGKIVLLILTIIFTLNAVGLVFLSDDNVGIQTVWKFVSVSFNTIASLILGYFFTKKK